MTMISEIAGAHSASKAACPIPVVVPSMLKILFRMLAIGITMPARRDVPWDRIR